MNQDRRSVSIVRQGEAHAANKEKRNDSRIVSAQLGE